jgi:hypothetical protein
MMYEDTAPFKITVLRDVTSDRRRCSGETGCLHLERTSSILKLEAAVSSKALVPIYQTTHSIVSAVRTY